MEKSEGNISTESPSRARKIIETTHDAIGRSRGGRRVRGRRLSDDKSREGGEEEGLEEHFVRSKERRGREEREKCEGERRIWLGGRIQAAKEGNRSEWRHSLGRDEMFQETSVNRGLAPGSLTPVNREIAPGSVAPVNRGLAPDHLTTISADGSRPMRRLHERDVLRHTCNPDGPEIILVRKRERRNTGASG